MEFTIQTEALKAINLFTEKKDVRHYLKGVNFTSISGDKTRLTASDWYTMATHTGAAHNDEAEIIIPSETVELALKIAGKKPSVKIQLIDGSWTLESIPFTPIDGRYPDCQRLWLVGEPDNAPCVLNPEVYSVMIKAQKACGLKPYSFQAWSHNGSLFFDNGIIRGIVMGLRDTLRTSAVPKF